MQRQVIRVVMFLAALLSLAAAAAREVTVSSSGGVQVIEVAMGLHTPWSLAFLPDGRMLVTERPGRMRLVGPDGALSAPLAGVPAVHARGQGGLLDVVLGPEFARDRRIYFSYAEPTARGARTAVARAVLDVGALRLDAVEVIFRQRDDPPGEHHWGSRLVFGRDGTLFVTLGERYSSRERAQDLDTHGRLWTHEHGPQGGDEVNIGVAGANYGWPVITFGREYVTGLRIGEGTARADVVAPVHYWVPSIAPSGMAFYTGSTFPHWQGNLFVGALRGQVLVRLVLDGERVVGEERLLRELGSRIRDVRQGPDGLLYVLDESHGRILRLAPR
ncbi:MAG: PQQ-dependent sugar dehydrogenase [Rhodocyclales bacterium]|nr:PQQ-dependent sugar dehydrogenase [Rhodocyclales bacterium]